MRLKTIIQIYQIYKTFPMKNFVVTNWKTTLAGVIAVVLAGVSVVYPEYAPLCAKIGTVAVSLGLIAAKDGNVTGGTTPQ